MHWGMSSRTIMRFNIFLSHNFRCSPPYLKCSAFRPSRPPDLFGSSNLIAPSISSMAISVSMTWSQWPKDRSSNSGMLDAVECKLGDAVLELARAHAMKWLAISSPFMMWSPSMSSFLMMNDAWGSWSASDHSSWIICRVSEFQRVPVWLLTWRQSDGLDFLMTF